MKTIKTLWAKYWPFYYSKENVRVFFTYKPLDRRVPTVTWHVDVVAKSFKEAIDKAAQMGDTGQLLVAETHCPGKFAFEPYLLTGFERIRRKGIKVNPQLPQLIKNKQPKPGKAHAVAAQN